ncbi:MAG TPA: Asp23/Gls24 family envelope stress response protein [Firmicutes bacterium]|nr:Asp23/Gls24 family envelope stress response protein [Bacillota bacterium]
MSVCMENALGTICIENEVIARIAGMTAMECYGIVGMAAKNVKDGFFQLLKVESLTKGIQVTVEDNRLFIDFHVIVEYGTNISAIADNMIRTVKYKLEQTLELEVVKINIFVEGVRVG